MEKYFVNYEIALELKEVGFNETCFKVYDEEGFIQDEKIMDELKLTKILAPLWDQVFDWLRIKHNVFACPIFSHINGKGYWVTFGKMGKTCNSEYNFDTYEQAREYVILEAIKLIEI